MIEGLDNWINILFIIILIFTIGVFHISNGKPKLLTILIISWTIVQSLISLSGFYTNTDAFPPRFGLVIIPILIVLTFSLLPKQRKFILNVRNNKLSTFLHCIRLPIEIILLQLFLYGMIPELMTFEGRNFDIIAGVSAPVIGILFRKNKISKKILLLWNFAALSLVLFILFNAILSAELPFQQFGFNQPNRAILFFPFILLPATIVPIVIHTHILDIIKLIKEIKTPPHHRQRSYKS